MFEDFKTSGGIFLSVCKREIRAEVQRDVGVERSNGESQILGKIVESGRCGRQGVS